MSEQQTIHRGLQADFEQAPWFGVDTSGLRVIDRNVLILVDECSAKTRGAVLLTDDMAWKMTQASETGVIAAVGDGAFLVHEDRSPWTGYRPKPGDRVFFERYAGTLVRGADERTYRLMGYSAIGGIYKPQAEIDEALAHDFSQGSGCTRCGITKTHAERTGAIHCPSLKPQSAQGAAA